MSAPSSGDRRYDSQGVQVHQQGLSGGSRFVTVGDGANHTTFLYDGGGNSAGSVSRGDGGPASDAKP